MELKAINPATGEKIKSYPLMDFGEVGNILADIDQAAKKWRESNFEDRSVFMLKARDLLLKNRQDYAKLMTREMGKPIVQSRAEIEKCAWCCEYYAEKARDFLSPELIETDAAKSYVTFEPLGIVLAVMPWNFPFWQVFRFAAPALMAGNAAILKHASNVPGCALVIEGIFREAGFPENIFRTVFINAQDVSRLIEDSRIKAVALTGSTQAGRAIAAQAGKMLKKTVLELGGSDPFIVLADANLDKSVEVAVKSRLVNAGQSCIAAKRFIVVETIREAFERKMVEKMKAIKMGDPLRDETEMGPLARADLRDDLHRQVTESIKKGAKLLWGGKVPNQRGAFYPPTVLSHVKKGMPAYDEEIFGPIAAIISARDEKQAIELANDTSFGLAATIFTADLKHGEEIAAKKIEAGSCFVNAIVHSDPRLPFGGIKGSGYGRELSHFGIREFLNIKTVYVGN